MTKLEQGVVCWHCKITYPTTHYTQRIRCYGCKEVISVSQDDETVSKEAGTHSDQYHAKSIMTYKHWTANSDTYAGSPNINSLPLEAISTWETKSGKRALLCGVTYTKEKFKLKGTIYDVNNMKQLLVDHFQFPSSSIRILAEKESLHHPTKSNIQAALQWLVKDCRSGDSLVFYFSGHGLRQPDFNGDERDGFDETICPMDFRTAGMILDNELNETIVRPLKKGVILHAIIDACHSGTILDLPYVYSPKVKKWVDDSPPSGAYKGTSGGLAISFSACEDNQLAADTTAFSDTGKQMEGAMTYTFTKAVRENRRVTYAALLSSMHKDIMEARKAKCFRFRRLFYREILQEPLMSSSEKFDVNKMLMI